MMIFSLLYSLKARHYAVALYSWQMPITEGQIKKKKFPGLLMIYLWAVRKAAWLASTVH